MTDKKETHQYIKQLAEDAMAASSLIRGKTFLVNACGNDATLLAPFHVALASGRHAQFLGEMTATIKNPARVTEPPQNRKRGRSIAASTKATEYQQKRAAQAKGRNALIPALRHAMEFDFEVGKLVWKISPSPRKRAGDEVGTVNQFGTRQVMFGGVRYVCHEIVFALTYGEWPTQRLGFRDDDVRNIHPNNLYVK